MTSGIHLKRKGTEEQNMPLLTELADFVGLVFYRYAAPTALPLAEEISWDRPF
jgi:hypothetical protein